MISYAKAKKLLPPGDVVYIENEDGSMTEATVLEVCRLHLRTNVGPLEFEDHGILWWLTPHGAPVPAFGGGKND